MTTWKTLLASAVIVLSPALASAACNWEKQQVNMSCAEGTTWDASLSACVPIATS
jgi:hypothetical protein